MNTLAFSPHKTPALMLLGTSSNVGKSIMTAAFCRIFVQDGWSVAPFKGQNMALNTYLLNSGEEIGFAQALQAQACGIAPQAAMNPLLLKPCSTTGSELFIMGKSQGIMNFKQYHLHKQNLGVTVQQAYDSLAEQYEIVVLEGAGSPAEINLKNHDLANMFMAQYAQAQTLLVGDIDRGGVYAALVGTLVLLEKQERARICGALLNKFRGDASLLDSANEVLKKDWQCPVVGVIPHIPHLGLPEEDSQGVEAYQQITQIGEDTIDVAVLAVPYMSDFADFTMLELEENVAVRYVHGLRDFGSPHIVIIPHSNNAYAMKNWLEKTELLEQVQKYSQKKQGAVFGLGVGFAFLGDYCVIHSPDGVSQQLQGFGLLPCVCHVHYGVQKKYMYTKLPVDSFTALEIHGQATVTVDLNWALELCNDEYNTQHFWLSTEGQHVGISAPRLGEHAEKGAVWGTTLCNVFNQPCMRDIFIMYVSAGKQQSSGSADTVDAIDKQLDALADHVRKAVDMDFIYKQLGIVTKK